MTERSLTALAGRALRSPTDVPRALGAELSCRWRTRGLPSQLDRLNALRQHDEYLLVVLDACRVGSLRTAADAYLHGEVETVRSAAPDTFGWAGECWHRRHAAGEAHDAAYISGATPIHRDLEFDDDDFEALHDIRPAAHIGEIVEVWRSDWDPRLGTCPPEPVTDAALERDADRMVVHYFQPHSPFIGEPRLLGHVDDASATPGDGEPVDKPIWDRVAAGAIGQRELADAYRGNLERVLGEVARLVRESDHDRVVVCADHGEALGEWGFYGHPRQVRLAPVRRVPWLEVEGVVDGAGPSFRGDDRRRERAEGEVGERLQQLGYI